MCWITALSVFRWSDKNRRRVPQVNKGRKGRRFGCFDIFILRPGRPQKVCFVDEGCFLFSRCQWPLVASFYVLQLSRTGKAVVLKRTVFIFSFFCFRLELRAFATSVFAMSVFTRRQTAAVGLACSATQAHASTWFLILAGILVR